MIKFFDYCGDLLYFLEFLADKTPTKRKKTQKGNPRGAKARRGSRRTASQRNAESSRSDEEEDMDVSIEQPNEVGASSLEIEVSMKEAVLGLLKVLLFHLLPLQLSASLKQLIFVFTGIINIVYL